MMITNGKRESLRDIVLKTRTPDQLKLFVTTWNMGNAEPAGIENIFGSQEDISRYDLYAIGLQESTYNVKGNEDTITHLQNRLKSIFRGYFVVQHCYRAQLQLYVFAKESLRHRISGVEQSLENTGFLHVFPNKGGILITCIVDGTKLAFVSCHLTAHEGVHHCEQRNASIVEILGGVRAGDKRIDISEQFHHVFWMGDMNYRVTFDTSTPENTKKNIATLNRVASKKMNHVDAKDIVVTVDEELAFEGIDDDDSDTEAPTKKAERAANNKKLFDMISKEQWKEMLELDELNREINSGRVLNDFVALQPAFPPTFKRSRNLAIPPRQSHGLLKWNFRRGSVTEDSIRNSQSAATEERSVAEFYHEKRYPSFTDRILFKSMKTFEGHVTPDFFTSCETAMSSDHKPVRAGFTVNLTKGRSDIYVHRQVVGRRTERVHGRKLRLLVSDLKGRNLEEMDSQLFGGGSDPYVVVTTDPPSLLLHREKIREYYEGVKSKVIKHNVNPDWKETLVLNLASVDLEGLARNATLIFQVWDEDTYNADDLIGCASIPLRDILLAIVQKGEFNFNDVLRCNSEVMGQLQGTIRLDGALDDVAEDANTITRERGHVNNFLTLALAEREQNQLNSAGCNCAIS
jgi:endonuclease/exonuclease/phosphatase family metal-dependent hydrolase